MSTCFYFKTAKDLSFENLREQAEKDGYRFGHMVDQFRCDMILCPPNKKPSKKATIPMCCTEGTCGPKERVNEDRLMTDGENALVLAVGDGNVYQATRYAWCGHPLNLLIYLRDFYNVGIESEYEMKRHLTPMIEDEKDDDLPF